LMSHTFAYRVYFCNDLTRFILLIRHLFLQEDIAALQHALQARDRSEVSSYIGNVLAQLVEVNDLLQCAGPRRKGTAFSAVQAPALDIRSYVERVAKHVQYPNICFTLCLAYIDRLAEESSDVHLYVTSLTAHRLFAAALLVAAKFAAEDGSDSVISQARSNAAADSLSTR
jgi:hypothetical protein